MRAKEVEFEMSEHDYEELLDEVYGDVQIAGMTFSTGYALRELDPIAFRCGKNDEEASHANTWECDECGEVYDNEDEAEDCCKESCDNCGGLFLPEELEGMAHICKDCIAESNELTEEEDN